MPDGNSKTLDKPKRRSVRGTSFVASTHRGRVVRGLEQEVNFMHRVREEQNKETLLIHLSGENGHGWTTLAIDRSTREWSIAQRRHQLDAAKAAYGKLYV